METANYKMYFIWVIKINIFSHSAKNSAYRKLGGSVDTVACQNIFVVHICNYNEFLKGGMSGFINDSLFERVRHRCM